MSTPGGKADELKAAIAALEAQRPLLGEAVVVPAIAALRKELDDLDATSSSEPDEERKNVTIVFVDVSGFTALAEKLDPEEVRSVINGCFDHLVPVVQKYGGTIDKFIGDEIMALFGAPMAHENDPERALRSALEMMESISAFNQHNGTDLRLHIGINTGPVVTGAIGSQERKDYSVMGDAVNLAARLEDASPDGEIYVGPDTYRLTETSFDFELLAPLSLKGKAERPNIYRLIGLKAVPKPARGIEGLRSKLVGRDHELIKIREVLTGLRSGVGGVLAVVGEAGVGKSRLVAEAFGTFSPDLARAEGRALSHTTGMSHWMARDVLRALLGCSENANTAELDLALRRSVEHVTPAEFQDVYPYLATLLHLELQDEMRDRVKFLSTEALHGRILHAFQSYVAARARREPLILFWEDLHWCDPSSFRVVETLLSLTNEIPLLLVLAYRPEEETAQKLQRQAETVAGQRFHLIEIAPLTREQSGSLVEALLQIENLPDRMHDLILDRAEGNPFFIEELLRSLLDSGAVTVRAGRIVASESIERAAVPQTVEGVLTARMDRLASTDKSALQNAAVIGRMFQQKVLETIGSSKMRQNLGSSLSELQRRDFIHPARQPATVSDDYIFKHAITQDVAYHALLKSRRKQIHQKVGEALEALFPDRLPELSPTLAYHFERAEARVKALKYLKQAGERAQAIFANTEAEAFYRSALNQAGSLQEKGRDTGTVVTVAKIHESLGDVLQLGGRHQEARASYAQSLELVSREDRVGRSRLQRKIGSAYTLERRFAAMTEAFDMANAELGDNAVEPVAEWWNEKMQILLEQMHLLYWQGMSEEMTQLADRYRPVIEERGTPIQRGTFFQRLGLSHLSRNGYLPGQEAVSLMELAVSTSSNSGDLGTRSHIRFTAGLVHVLAGNLDEAIEHLHAALALGERVGDRVVQARCHTYLAVAHRRAGNEAETRRSAERTGALAGQLGMVEYVAMADANLAWLAWREKRPSDVESLGSEALKLWHGMEDPYGFDWMALLPLIAVAVENDRLGEALEHTGNLFGEHQHPLPPKLKIAAEEVLDGAKDTATAATKTKLQQMLEVAHQNRYL